LKGVRPLSDKLVLMTPGVMTMIKYRAIRKVPYPVLFWCQGYMGRGTSETLAI